MNVCTTCADDTYDYAKFNEKKVWQEKRNGRKSENAVIDLLRQDTVYFLRYGLLFSECLNISHLYCEWLMNTFLANIRSQAHIFTRHFHFNFESIYVPLYRCGYRPKRWTSHWCRSAFPTRHLHPTFPFRKRLKYAIARRNKRASEQMNEPPPTPRRFAYPYYS